MDLNRSWRFDESVAIEFDTHVRQNIPGYEQVIAMSLHALRKTCRPDDKIAEIGCATGYTLELLTEAGFTNLVGVDSAQAMLDRCTAKNAQLVCSEEFPLALGPFRAVLVNWTLHFVAPEKREGYLRVLTQGMAPDGIIILTEKSLQSSTMESLYHDFKRAKGMSDDEIAAKKRSLVGVLETLPHEWYLDILKRLGFTTEILCAQYGFVTYLAHRRLN
jgi:tRNA (cmo5U34)-methyltransferase